jgi:hypothetical protein
MKLHQGGTMWILDVASCDPGPSATSTCVARPPGRAAEAYAAIKAAKYVNQPNSAPFVVETGGYMHSQANLFLDRYRPAADSRT